MAETLWGLATFEIFVASSLLILFYYLGTVAGPLVAVFVVRRLLAQREHLELPQFEPGDRLLQSWARTRLGLTVLAVLAMVFFELLWRVLFEAVLAYFQMRDYLSGLAQG